MSREIDMRDSGVALALTPISRLGVAAGKLAAVGIIGYALGSVVALFVPEAIVAKVALQQWGAILSIAATTLGLPKWLIRNFVLRTELHNADVLFFEGLIDEDEHERLRADALSRHKSKVLSARRSPTPRAALPEPNDREDND